MDRPQKITALRSIMEAADLDGYILPSSDPHQNEYIPSCWQFRQWISGFTGSAGTVVITRESAGLWTDSRYFIQAEKQLTGSSILLHRLKVPHTPEHLEWMKENLKSGSRIGIDDRYFSMSAVRTMKSVFKSSGLQLVTDIDLIDPIWKERPGFPQDKVFELDLEYTGLSRVEKIQLVRDHMLRAGAGYHVITTLDDIAWLLNLRGNDVAFCPVFISYFLISPESNTLYIDADKIPVETQKKLELEGISIRPYESISSDLKAIPAGSSLLYAPEKVASSLIQSVSRDVLQLEAMNITTGLKSIKNDTEISGLRKVMIKDGVAWVQTLAWLDRQMKNGSHETEWSLAQKIAEFRSAQKDYRGESFHPISSYGWHGAVVHYTVTPEESIEILPRGILLLDSGGHYLNGTTDTTRTLALSIPDEKQKSDFTRALKGTLSVSMLRFPMGTKGYQMDILARKSLWDAGLNYGHGTGHGVGHYLSVHEGPQTIGTSASGYMMAAIEPGMVTTVEPGIYRNGEYGMRIENMTLVVADQDNEFGTFYRFETLTLVPIDRTLIKKELLTGEEIDWINRYHDKVFKELEGMLNEEDKNWLTEAVRPI